MDTLPSTEGQVQVPPVPQVIQPVQQVPAGEPAFSVSQMAQGVTQTGSVVQYAGFGIRFVALIIDAIIIAIISGILGGILGAFGAIVSQGSDMGVLLISAISQILSFVVTYAYYVGMLVYHDGATIGKMLVHIKVVSVDGQQLTLGKALIRETIGKWISSIVLLLGYITVAFDTKKQGWHDKIAGTYVIKV